MYPNVSEYTLHYFFAGIYYEDGCAHKFLVWLKAWAGCVGVVSLLIIAIQVMILIFFKIYIFPANSSKASFSFRSLSYCGPNSC
jgi:hypothetical protein